MPSPETQASGVDRRDGATPWPGRRQAVRVPGLAPDVLPELTTQPPAVDVRATIQGGAR